MSKPTKPLIPAKAGTQTELQIWPRQIEVLEARWIPALAGTSGGRA